MTGETTDNVAVQNAGLDGTIKQGVGQNRRQCDRIGFSVVFFGRGGGTRRFELRGRTWWRGRGWGKCEYGEVPGSSHWWGVLRRARAEAETTMHIPDADNHLTLTRYHRLLLPPPIRGRMPICSCV